MENQELQPINNLYHNSKVYKLQADDQYYYFGSTTQLLCYRLSDHKRSSRYEKKGRKLYVVFTHDRFINGEIKIVLMEEFKLENRQQLLKEEDKYIQQHINDPLCLNSFRSIINYEERLKLMRERGKLYREMNKEKLKEYFKLYNNTHKEHKKWYDILYNDTHKDKRKEYRKVFNNLHKEDLKIYRDTYYNKNKDIIKRKEKERYAKQEKIKCICGFIILKKNYKRHQTSIQHKHILENGVDKNSVVCPCGSVVTIQHKIRHEKTKKHQEFIKEQQ